MQVAAGVTLSLDTPDRRGVLEPDMRPDDLVQDVDHVRMVDEPAGRSARDLAVCRWQVVRLEVDTPNLLADLVHFVGGENRRTQEEPLQVEPPALEIGHRHDWCPQQVAVKNGSRPPGHAPWRCRTPPPT